MAELTLHTVTLTLCSLCLDGAGGECHVPGCSLCRSQAPDIPLRDNPTVTVDAPDAGEVPATRTVHTVYVPPGWRPEQVWDQIAAGQLVDAVPGGGWAVLEIDGGGRIGDRWSGGELVRVVPPEPALAPVFELPEDGRNDG